MSRNFELLKRAEEERLTHPLAAAAAADTIQPPRPLRPVPTDARRAAQLCPKDASRPAVGNAEPEIVKLVQNLFILNSIAPPRVVLFSPVVRSQEPDFVAVRVAEVLSEQHVGQVCVVDADVERPSLHAYFNVNNVAGFTTMLGSSHDPLHSFGHGVSGCNLTVVTAGPPTRHWINMLGSESGTERLRELRSQFDFVLVCAPPLHEAPGIASLGQRVDGTVLIVEAHDVKRDVALRVKQEWERANTRLLGAVLNNRTFPIPPALYARL